MNFFGFLRCTHQLMIRLKVFLLIKIHFFYILLLKLLQLSKNDQALLKLKSLKITKNFVVVQVLNVLKGFEGFRV